LAALFFSRRLAALASVIYFFRIDAILCGKASAPAGVTRRVVVHEHQAICMHGRSPPAGFTLIEVLIVVVLVAILAATLIPQLSSSANDAKESSLRANLKSLRTQIDMYKLHHNGQLPAIVGGALPQLTSATDASGNVGAGAGFSYGPYILNGLPPNPITGASTVTATTSSPPSSESGNGGWLYNPSTGHVAADSQKYLSW
jgi:prepilin-type N-terminal cleavage/methylation domain-containing protein